MKDSIRVGKLGLMVLGLVLAPTIVLADECDVRSIKQHYSRCSNAMDVADWTTVAVYCREVAQDYGVCADSESGESRQGSLTLKAAAMVRAGIGFAKSYQPATAKSLFQNALSIAKGVLANPNSDGTDKQLARQTIGNATRFLGQLP